MGSACARDFPPASFFAFNVCSAWTDVHTLLVLYLLVTQKTIAKTRFLLILLASPRGRSTALACMYIVAFLSLHVWAGAQLRVASMHVHRPPSRPSWWKNGCVSRCYILAYLPRKGLDPAHFCSPDKTALLYANPSVYQNVSNSIHPCWSGRASPLLSILLASCFP